MPEYRLAKLRGKYVAVWYDEKGHRHRQSLGTANPSLARAQLGSFVAAIEEANRPEALTVDYIVGAYLKERGAEILSTKVLGYHWRGAKDYFTGLFPREVTEAFCKAYAVDRGTKVKPGTIRKELGLVRNSLMWAFKHKKWIAPQPYVWLPAEPPARDIRLTQEEFDRLLHHCKAKHARLFVELALRTAARSGAILDLTWDRVDLEKRRIDFRVRGDHPRRKGRAVVPINDRLRTALVEAKRDTLSPFVIEWSGGKVKSVKKAVATAARNARVICSPHVLRHTAATFMAEDDVPMSVIAQMLGHKDSRTTERIYARFSPSYLLKATRALER